MAGEKQEMEMCLESLSLRGSKDMDYFSIAVIKLEKVLGKEELILDPWERFKTLFYIYICVNDSILTKFKCTWKQVLGVLILYINWKYENNVL